MAYCRCFPGADYRLWAEEAAYWFKNVLRSPLQPGDRPVTRVSVVYNSAGITACRPVKPSICGGPYGGDARSVPPEGLSAPEFPKNTRTCSWHPFERRSGRVRFPAASPPARRANQTSSFGRRIPDATGSARSSGRTPCGRFTAGLLEQENNDGG